ncbi:hypothetical protein [Thermomonas sp. HDW16]|uniref:hypothetical protein n=1 Tax=Thermomonas sp. HDW16 TaxID=2714945 RepID=UPI001407E59C|nr:hypothetical protein [Thermomonas sp. HDW16]QIL20084.1 hypothetical protein G7079_04670 [Thermomonas sp. HDW16]
MKTRASQSFAVSPPPAHAWMLLVALGGVLPLGIIGALWFSGQQAQLSGVATALVIVPLVLALLLLAMKRRSVELRDGVLDVRAALFRHRVAVSELDLANARVVDLRERTELRPVLKTGGMSIIGFDAGNFRLRHKFGKAFCLLTDRHRVLWLPERNGTSQLLLSLAQPQAMLDALRAD